MSVAVRPGGWRRVRQVVRAVGGRADGGLPDHLAQGRPVTPERLAAYALLLDLLQEHGRFGLHDIAKGPLGQPHLPDRPELSISLAHARGAAAASVSRVGPVGIDVEEVAGFDPATAEIVLTARQRDLIAAAPAADRAFIRLWARKEAVGKAFGVGLEDDILSAPVEHGSIYLRDRCILLRDLAAPPGLMAAQALFGEVG